MVLCFDWLAYKKIRWGGVGVVKVRRKAIRHRVKLWGMTIHGGVI